MNKDNKDTQIMDQTVLAQDVSNKIKFEFRNQFLVKPLDPVMVEKEFSKPIPKGETKDEDGIEATDYDEVEKEVKSVPSDYRKAVVLKVPAEYKPDNFNIEVGNIIVYKEGAARWFDLCKDTQLVDMYAVIGIEK